MTSHLPMLKLICATIAFPHYRMGVSFEFGCGEHSTPLFAGFSNRHYAIDLLGTEHDARTRAWVQKIAAVVASDKHVTLSAESLSSALVMLAFAKPQIVFVDGPGFRPECVNYAARYCDTVVAHDTEAACHGWGSVPLDNGWRQFTRASDEIPDPLGAWTTCWTRDARVAAVLAAVGLRERKIPRGEA